MNYRWRILGGGIAGTVILSAYGVLVCGFDSVWQYVHVLRDPWINPEAARMPNLHGLSSAMGGGAGFEATLIAIVVAMFIWTIRRVPTYELQLAASLVAGLLVAFHSGVADTVILLVAFVLILGTSSNVPLRAGSALLLTPSPYFFLLGGAPVSAVMPAALLLLAAGLPFAGSLALVPDLPQEPVAPGDIGGGFHTLGR